jgi:hypothetical protein
MFAYNVVFFALLFACVASDNIENGSCNIQGDVCVVNACFAGFEPVDNACERCKVGFYSTRDDIAPCRPCTNKPAHATYTRSGWATEVCPYECPPNTIGPQCQTYYGILVFVSSICGAFAAVAMVVYVIRWRRRKRKPL